jgi:3-phenylpropionate/trans-cinnamate dioxygenase ferredoxin reductase subunit
MAKGDERIVIVGAGHAGGTAAALLRQFGFAGPITMLGDELIAPYQRPPLSKASLKGEIDQETLKLRPDVFYTDRHVSLRLGVTVTALDRAAKQVICDNGDHIPYDILILAMGARARALPVPGADLQGLHSLRSIADAEGLREVLEPGRRIAIVGGGYIGLEVAASARGLGAEAVVIEREARVLARVASEPLSTFFEAYHRAHGVEILTAASVAAFEGGADGFISAVQLADGRRIACDAALIGVGAVACDGLARTAGIVCENGIVVDLEARTSDPAIFAIGDATWRPMPHYGRMSRLESVPNAIEQARQAACSIMARSQPVTEVPWFWSDQYELKLQIAGVSFDPDDIVVRGAPDAAKFAVFHLKEEKILAVEAVNSAGDFMAGKKFIGQGTRIDRRKLADSGISIKDAAA